VSELLHLGPEQEVVRISEKVTKSQYEDIILLLRDGYNVMSTLDLLET
jgi:hypothetical protein